MTFWGYAAEYAGVSLLGAAVGLGELVSRYKDDPWSAIKSWAGKIYLLINAAAAAGALGLILTYDWKLGASGDAVAPTRLLVAGTGAMALFRSSLFTVRIGNADVGVGPSTFLSLILAACDRGVDRKRAESRARDAWRVMHNVDYEKAQVSLPTVSLALMQNLDDNDQTLLANQLDRISKDEDISTHAKALALGLALSRAVGFSVLTEAKNSLGSEILREPSEIMSSRPATPDVAAVGPDQSPPPDAGGLPATPQTPPKKD